MSSFEPYVFVKSLHISCKDQTGWIALVRYKRRIDDPDPDEEEGSSGSGYEFEPFEVPEFIEVVMDVNPRPVRVRNSYCLKSWYTDYRGDTQIAYDCYDLPGYGTYIAYDQVVVRVRNPAHPNTYPPKPDDPPPPPVPPQPEKLTDVVILKDYDRASRWLWNGTKIYKDLSLIEEGLEKLIESLRNKGMDSSEIADEIREYKFREEKEFNLDKEIQSVEFIFCNCSEKEKECGECCISCCDIIELVLKVYGEKVPRRLLDTLS